MSAAVQVISEVERKVHLVVPAKQVDEQAHKRLQEVAKTASMDGFRPGHVPEKVLKQRFGEPVRQEAISTALEKAFQEALKELKLTPISAPSLDVMKNEAGKDVEAAVTFEVYPEIEIKGLSKIKLQKVQSSVTDQDLDQMMQTLRKQQADWKAIDRPAQNDDRLMIDFDGKMEGKEFQGGSAKDVPLILGSKQMIPGFEDGLLGVKTGETRVLKLTFPADYFSKDLANKAAEFTVLVKSISEAILPELDQAFAKRFNVDSIDALRKEVRGNMERELEFALKNRFKTQLMNALLQENQVPTPKSLVSQEIQHLKQQALRQMKMFKKDGDANQLPDMLFESEAKRRVELGILMNKVIVTHNLKPDQERVKVLLQKMVSVYEDPGTALQQAFQDKQEMAQIEQSVLEEQVVEKLCESITVETIEQGFYDVMKSIRP